MPAISLTAIATTFTAIMSTDMHLIAVKASKFARHRGRLLDFDREPYRRHNMIDRCMGWIARRHGL